MIKSQADATHKPLMAVRLLVLPYEGTNFVDFPKNGRVVDVAMDRDGEPGIVVLAERDADKERRAFFRTRGPLPTSAEQVEVGAYLGFAQSYGDYPIYILEAQATERG
jgi:hypothetical protein